MSIERIPLIAGNWKMNGLRADAIALAKAVVDRVAGAPPCEILMCPPATLLTEVGRLLAGSGIALGGQDCHAADGGAHTGDISARMLADAGCRYVILGHSERRAGYREGDDLVASKVAAAGHAGLTAIVCVGETEAERDAGRTLDVLSAQIEGSLPPDGIDPSNTVIAYEPVWAIGTGCTPTIEQVAEAHGHIRARLAARIGDAEVRVLYGGSVKPANAEELLAVADVDGALIGGASLNAEDFWAIARACPGS
jgi:triosephosphate isomerase